MNPTIDLFYRVPGGGPKLPSCVGLYASGEAGPDDWHYYASTGRQPTVKAAVAGARANLPDYEWRGSRQSKRS